MPEFTPKKHKDFNDGNQFVRGDILSPNEINKIIETILYVLKNIDGRIVDGNTITIGNVDDFAASLIDIMASGRVHLWADGYVDIEGDQVTIKGVNSGSKITISNTNGISITTEKGQKLALNGNDFAEIVKALQKNISDLQTATKRIVNLEASLSDDMFITNSEVAYERAVPANVAPYAEVNKIGGMTKVTSGMFHAPVTKLESIGKNLLDISKGLNACLVDNGDGTYTMSKTSSGRFSNKIPIFIPANTVARVHCKIHSYSNSTYNYAQIQVFKANGNSDHTLPLRDVASQVLSTDSDIVGVTIYLDANNAVGDYVTFSEPQIEFGTTSTDYAPYSADPIDTFEIPPEVVQDVEGYGVGMSADKYNYTSFDGDTVKQINHCGVKVFDGTEPEWAMEVISSGKNFYFNAEIPNTYAQRVVSNHFTSNSGLGSALRNNIWISATAKINVTADGYANLAEWKAQLAEWAAAGAPLTVIYALTTPEITNITHLMPAADNFLKVQSNGRIRAVNEHSLAVPTTITYQKEG